jgi:hypothetical protein
VPKLTSKSEFRIPKQSPNLEFQFGKSSSRVPQVMPLFREEALAAALPSTGKDRAAALGSHPGTKAVLTFPCSL